MIGSIDRLIISIGILTILSTRTEALLHDLPKISFESLRLSSTCRHDLEYFRRSYYSRELWAQKMADASGRIEFGFVWGNNMMLGSPVHCSLLNQPFEFALYRECDTESFCNITEIEPPFPVDYKVTYAKQIAKIQINNFIPKKRVLHIGTCAPASCSTDDTTKFIDELLHTEEFFKQGFFENTTEVLFTKDLKPRKGFSKDPAVKILWFLVTVFLSLSTIGTISYAFGEETRNTPLHKYLACFSLQENYRSIISTKSHPGEIEALHGFRAAKLFWIICMHAIVYAGHATKDIELATKYITNPKDPAQVSADFSVDAFLSVSGLVLAYGVFSAASNLQDKSKIALYLKSMMLRIIRLTPTFYILFLMYFVITMYLNDTSQLTYYVPEEKLCREQWWYNLLFISNLKFAPKEMCMNWSWYLAVDSQCFAIVLPVLLLALKYRRCGVGLLLALLVTSSSIVGYYGYHSRHMFNLISLQKYGFYLYSSISSRLGPYIVGALGGWFLVETKRELKLDKTQAKIAWVFCMICFLFPIIRRMNPAIDNPIERMLYIALSRISFATGFIWIIVACETGFAKSTKKFFMSDLFKPISRLSYSSYLLNPTIVIFASMANNTPMEANLADWYIKMLGYFAITLTVSFIFVLIFEMPIHKLQKLFLKR